MINNKYDIYKIEILRNYNKYFKLSEEHGYNIDFINTLPSHKKEDYLQDLEFAKAEVSSKDEKFQFIPRLEKYINLLSLLSEAKINSMYYRVYSEIEQNDSILSNLKNFKPLRAYAEKPQYNLNSNVSGRLTINKGPNILTLPRKYRSIIDTRFKSGKVISIDFSSLEPRLCLGLIGKSVKGDLYEKIKEVLNIDVDRSVIKRAVISVLYGAHYSSLQGISLEKSKELFNNIKSYFELDRLLEMSTNIDSVNIRRNFFGRPLWNLDETKENILINNYIQSSAVDLSLTYFSDLVEKIDLSRAVPIYVLHDAMIFDLDINYENDFVNIINQGYNHSKLGYFPLDIDIFNIKNVE